MLDFLRQEGVSERLIGEIADYRKFYKVNEDVKDRVPVPQFMYYGAEVWEEAASAILAGEHLLLSGPKATGKNVLAQCLAAAFGRPEWDISLYINTDAASLVGADTFVDGSVRLKKGPVLSCAEEGGFGVLDEINMAKNEALAVLHAVLDFRRVIDVPGYDRVKLHEAARFIATMNYGYAGTRDLNEALASRFMIINMPLISGENLKKLLKTRFPALKDEWARQFAELFMEIRGKCEGGEISSKALDLRGLVSAVRLMEQGLSADRAVGMGLVNKCFDDFERQLVADIVAVRLPKGLESSKIFEA